jgi:hypothetical protein
MSYWKIGEVVRDELETINLAARDAYGAMESEDDPAVLADDLSDIKKRMEKLSAGIGEALAPLRKTGMALDSIPEIKTKKEA